MLDNTLPQLEKWQLQYVQSSKMSGRLFLKSRRFQIYLVLLIVQGCRFLKKKHSGAKCNFIDNKTLPVLKNAR